jgi:hypothetical protein
VDTFNAKEDLCFPGRTVWKKKRAYAFIAPCVSHPLGLEAETTSKEINEKMKTHNAFHT